MCCHAYNYGNGETGTIEFLSTDHSVQLSRGHTDLFVGFLCSVFWLHHWIEHNLIIFVVEKLLF